MTIDMVNTAATHCERHKYNIFRAWLPELCASGFALGLIVAIAALLAAYNGRPTPDWGQNLNLNAILALFSTFLRATLVVLIAQTISQRKWRYFWGHSQPLSQLQKYDAGSRGILGALSLIPAVFSKDYTTLIAAGILVISFLVGPFVQQASRTAQCSFPISGLEASIPYAHFVPRQGGYRGISSTGPFVAATDTHVALLSSATAPNGVENRVLASCSSGNCTFSSTNPAQMLGREFVDTKFSVHSTVGLCSKCIDARSLVATNITVDLDGVTQHFDLHKLPNDMTLNRSVVAQLQPSPDLSWLGDLLTDEFRFYARWAYANATFFATGGEDHVVASVCSLYPCLKTYNTSLSHNQLSESLIQSRPMSPELRARFVEEVHVASHMESLNGLDNWHYDYVQAAPHCSTNESAQDEFTSADVAPSLTTLRYYGSPDQEGPNFTYGPQEVTVAEPCTYRHSAQFANAIARTLTTEFFTGACWVWREIMCGTEEMSTLGTGVILEALYSQGNPGFLNTSRWFDMFTNAISNRYRNEWGSIWNATARERGEALPLDLVYGLAWETKFCVTMRWYWLLLPISLTVLSILLLLYTILTDWRRRWSRPIWKDSILPLILYSDQLEFESQSMLSKQNHESLTNHRSNELNSQKDLLMDGSEMMRYAKGLQMRFCLPAKSDVQSTKTDHGVGAEISANSSTQVASENDEVTLDETSGLMSIEAVHDVENTCK